MKLVYCLECGDIFSPGVEKPSRCKCGYSVAKWRDPRTGTLEVASRWTEGHLRILGLNNSWLASLRDLPQYPRELADKAHREATQDTCDLAVGYLFQTQSRNCPIIMVTPDESQIFYVKDLLDQVPWYGKFDCKKDATLGTKEDEHAE